MTTIDVDGPSLAPTSGGPARQLVVLLHGYGADGADLMPLAEAWRPALPDAAFIAPDAPDPCDINPFGRQWFPLTLGDRARIAGGLATIRARLDAFLDRQLATLGLGPERLALVGFSQGAMLALDAGLRHAGPIAAIVSFSGLLGVPPAPRSEAYPPVLLAHGTEDPVVQFAAMAAAEQGLVAAGVPVQAHARPGLGHGIDEAELVLAARFLKAAFGT